MYIHFLTIAFRNLILHKAFSAINIAGLALGMSCFLFIALWINDERRVDNFHTNSDRLYVVYQTIRTNGKVDGAYTTPVRYRDRRSIPIDDLKRTAPEVVGINFYATGYELPWGHSETFQVGDRIYKLDGSRTSNEFFSMFSYPLIAGDPKTALADVSGIAISRKMAELFFDTPGQAIGKSIRYENKLDLKINAVFENVPEHSSLKFDFLINWELQMTQLDWSSPNVLTTIKVREGTDIAQVETKMNRLLQSRLDKNEPFKTELGLRPFNDRYLVANFVNGKPEGGRIEYINIFIGVAVFILLIACINFMNLSTARSVRRAKEVGVRKVIGSSRRGLIAQFFGESVVLSFIALVVSLVILHALLPAFNSFTGKQISLSLLEPQYWFMAVALVIVTGFVSGSYPALFLSNLKPAAVVKGTLRFTAGALLFRKSLATFQFVISIALLIATLVISMQTRYVQHTHLGYNKENLVYIRVEGELATYKNYALFKERLTTMPGIAAVDRSSEAPHAMTFVVDVDVDGNSETGGTGRDAIMWEGKEKGASVGFKPMSVGFDFLKIMDLKLAEGRDFSRSYATDSSDAFMVNEEAVKQMGMKDPIGKWISAWQKKGHIIGILKNYNTHSLHEPIKPLVVDVKEYESFGVIIVRTTPGKTKEALASMENAYKSINPNYAFAYQFLDVEYDKLYGNEQVVAKLSNAFAVLAITISCLGLLGLVMFSVEQRAKEFGIRKVLGATVINIVSLISSDFLKLIVISFCIAAPLAGYLMYEWLQGFAYRIELSWWIFALSGAVAVVVAIVTICVQAIQSATDNPVNVLKTE